MSVPSLRTERIAHARSTPRPSRQRGASRTADCRHQWQHCHRLARQEVHRLRDGLVRRWCVGNFGWRPAAIAKAIERFKGPDYVYPGYAYAPWTELARLLASRAPRAWTTEFRATGGSG